jgi:hypothetical protein
MPPRCLRPFPEAATGDTVVIECNAYRDEMMDVLYGEADAETRRRFAEHEAGCATCRQELLALRQVRRQLAGWALPADLRPRRAAVWPHVPRVAALAAGLVVALFAGLGLAGSEVRYEDGRLDFRLGRAAATGDVQALLMAQEDRHRAEIEGLRAELRQERPADELVTRVADMIRESETRQAVLVSATVSRLREESEEKRRYDLARVGAGLSYLDGKAGLQAARTTELVGHVLQATQNR